MSVSNLPLANQITRQFADFSDVDMKFANKATFETAITNYARIPDGWLAYCVAEKKWFQADKATGTAKGVATLEDIDNATTGLWDDRGDYDASSGQFPSTGGSGSNGSIKKGDIWTIGTSGTLGGEAVIPMQTVRAITDNPGQSSLNWRISKGGSQITNADALAEGSSHLFLTSAERSKLSNLPANTNSDLTSKLTGVLATDAETQITSTVAEDNKMVSRLKLFNFWNWVKGQVQTITAVWNFTARPTYAGDDLATKKEITTDILAILGNELDDITANTSVDKVGITIYRPCKINNVYADLKTVATGSSVEFDVRKNGTTIFTTRPTIDAGEFSSKDAAIPPALNPSAATIAAGDTLTFFITQVGSGTAGKGAKITLLTTLV